MGLRLNIAKEPPTQQDNQFFIFNSDKMLLEGGAWELSINNLVNYNDESGNINRTREKCKTYPNCFMCSCFDDEWTKITIEDLKNQDNILKDNQNIVYTFLLEDISDEDYKTKKFCSYQYIIQHPHRDYIWINIS
jgi:hypothetical protein